MHTWIANVQWETKKTIEEYGISNKGCEIKKWMHLQLNSQHVLFCVTLVDFTVYNNETAPINQFVNVKSRSYYTISILYKLLLHQQVFKVFVTCGESLKHRFALCSSLIVLNHFHLIMRLDKETKKIIETKIFCNQSTSSNAIN